MIQRRPKGAGTSFLDEKATVFVIMPRQVKYPHPLVFPLILPRRDQPGDDYSRSYGVLSDLPEKQFRRELEDRYMKDTEQTRKTPRRPRLLTCSNVIQMSSAFTSGEQKFDEHARASKPRLFSSASSFFPIASTNLTDPRQEAMTKCTESTMASILRIIVQITSPVQAPAHEMGCKPLRRTPRPCNPRLALFRLLPRSAPSKGERLM